MRRFTRAKLCWGLLALLAFPLTGCGDQGELKEGAPKNAPAATGPPPDVKDMEKDMMKPKK